MRFKGLVWHRLGDAAWPAFSPDTNTYSYCWTASGGNYTLTLEYRSHDGTLTEEQAFRRVRNPGAFSKGHRTWNTGKQYEIIPRVSPRPDRLKQCTGPCSKWLPIDCFNRCAQNPDGRQHQCAACRSERRSALRNGAKRVRPFGLQKERKTG